MSHAPGPDTFGDTLAFCSPQGHMSKRYKEAHIKKWVEKVWGKNGLQINRSPEPETKKANLLRRASQLRELAARGMGISKNIREAERLEKEAAV